MKFITVETIIPFNGNIESINIYYFFVKFDHIQTLSSLDLFEPSVFRFCHTPLNSVSTKDVARSVSTYDDAVRYSEPGSPRVDVHLLRNLFNSLDTSSV